MTIEYQEPIFIHAFKMAIPIIRILSEGEPNWASSHIMFHHAIRNLKKERFLELLDCFPEIEKPYIRWLRVTPPEFSPEEYTQYLEGAEYSDETGDLYNDKFSYERNEAAGRGATEASRAIEMLCSTIMASVKLANADARRRWPDQKPRNRAA